MKAAILEQTTSLKKNKKPLKITEVAEPAVGDGDDVLVKVSVCGVCHTELDEIEGRILLPSFPVILGHQVVGVVAGQGRRCLLYTSDAADDLICVDFGGRRLIRQNKKMQDEET